LAHWVWELLSWLQDRCEVLDSLGWVAEGGPAPATAIAIEF
jgi:hypothetical protein